jgi:hypothetical protein
LRFAIFRIPSSKPLNPPFKQTRSSTEVLPA